MYERLAGDCYPSIRRQIEWHVRKDGDPNLMSAIYLMIPVFFAAVSNAEGIATGIAGVLAPVLAELVKRVSGTSGFKAMLIAVVVSAVVAVAALYMAGEITTVGDVIKQAMTVFGIATIVYKTFTAAMSPATT